MKVVKPGRPQKGWSRKFKCTGNGNQGGGCGATLLVEQADVYTTSSSHYDGSTDYYHTFQCPCGVETDLPSSVSLPFDPPAKSTWLKRRAASDRDYDVK